MGKGKFCFPLLLPCYSIKTLKLRGRMLCPRESALSQHVAVCLRSQCCHQLDVGMEGECPGSSISIPRQSCPGAKPPHFLTVKKRRESRTGLALQGISLNKFLFRKVLK